MEKNGVLVVGSLNYDYILRTDHLPQKGETLTAESFEICAGGKGANQAVQCAKLGLPTYMVGAVGDDFMGTFLYNGLKEYGVEVSRVKIEHGTSGFAMASAAGKGNIFATIVKGTNEMVCPGDIDALEALFPHIAVVILQLEIPIETVEYAITQARRHACTVVINTAPAKAINRASLALCDIVVMNEVESRFYCEVPSITNKNAGEYVKQLSAEFGNTSIITLGSDGAVISAGGAAARHFPAYDIDAVETTGAGDSFIGGLAYGIIHSINIDETIAFASCCSGITIQNPGGQPAMPALDQVLPLIEKYKQQNKKFA
jgi:ribokinase